MPGKSRTRQIAEQEIREAVSVAVSVVEGRYIKALDRRAHGYALLGHTNQEIAELIGVDPSTFDRWMVEHPSLKAAIRKARTDDHVAVVRAVHRAARGFRHKETKLHVVGGKVKKTDVTKTYPPSMDAARLLLSNRQGERWRDKPSDSGGGTINLALILERAGLGDDAKPVPVKVLPKDDA